MPGILSEGAEEASRPELNRETNPVMRTTRLSHQLTVSGIEVKVTGELLLGRVAGIAAVPRTLFVGQEPVRHGVRDSELPQWSGSGPKIRSLHAAKVLCGIGTLCDRFRTTSEALA